MGDFRCAVFSALLATIFLSFAPLCRAEEWAIESSTNVRTELNDNYRLTTLPHENASVLAAGVAGSAARNTEASALGVNFALSGVTVRGLDEPNQANGQLALAYSLSGLNDRYGFKTEFLRDSTLDNELGATGVVLRRGQRNTLTLAPTWSHAFSERWSSQAQIYAAKTTYAQPDAASTATPGGTDYRYGVLSASLSYQWSEGDKLDAQLSHSDYRTLDKNTLSRTNDLKFSWDHAFSERLAGTMTYGRYRSHTAVTQLVASCAFADALSTLLCQFGIIDYFFVPLRQDFNSKGTLFNGSLQYTLDERTRLEAHVSRQLAPSGASALLQTDTGGLSLSRDWSPNIRGGIDYSQSSARYIGSANIGGATQPRYQAANAFVSWQVLEKASIDLGYRAVRSAGQQGNSTARSNMIFAALKYEWPRQSWAH